jgi:sigma-54 specific flagellar transcriptional regulator A
VLLRGESGTGKELVAHAIHYNSERRNGPFVKVNCAALPETLMESELFGHERGAFTGALARRKGRFELAHGGTLFLDEIGELSQATQVKLLRVLQERVFERVGNHTQIRCNVRIIAATHRNLEDSIRRSAFREDLFYRLNVFPIEMPALRTRLEDLPALVREFAERNVAEGRGRLQLTQRALQALGRYRWPGNVRELANLIERLSILCAERRCDLPDLPAKYRPADAVEDLLQATESAAAELLAPQPAKATVATSELAKSELETGDDREALTQLTRNEPAPALAQLPPQGLDLREHLYRIERDLIHQALSRSGGTVAHAARLLGLRRTTLVEKLRKFEMLNETAVTEV